MRTLVILLLLLYLSCSNDKKDPTIEAKEILSFSFLPEKKLDQMFGILGFENDTSFSFVYLDSSHNLVVHDLRTSRKLSIDLARYLTKKNFYSSDVHNDHIYILNRDSLTILDIKITKDLLLLDSIYSLKDLLDWNYYYLFYQQKNMIKVNYPYVIISYGTHDYKLNYLDNFSYLLLNLTCPDYCVEKRIHFPAGYQKGKYYLTNVHLDFSDNKTLAYVFETGSDIVKMNFISPEDGMLKEKINASFKSFNNAKVTDLAYVRKYLKTTERIKNLIADTKGNILIIKKASQDHINEPPQYEYYFYDNQLRLKYHGRFKHQVNPLLTFKYKNGFLLFENLNKAYYYELP